MDEFIFRIHSDMFFFRQICPRWTMGIFFYHFMGVGAFSFRSAGKKSPNKVTRSRENQVA